MTSVHQLNRKFPLAFYFVLRKLLGNGRRGDDITIMQDYKGANTVSRN